MTKEKIFVVYKEIKAKNVLDALKKEKQGTVYQVMESNQQDDEGEKPIKGFKKDK